MTLSRYDDSIVRLRYRIVPGAAPWIAAQYPPDGEAEAFDGTVFQDGLTGILRAGGGKAA